MKRVQTEGIVLHSIKYGESSMIVHILTRDEGRQSYLVQGVRSIRGHGNRASVMQPMFLLSFEAIVNPKSELRRMADVHLSEPLHTIPFDVRKSTIALYMAELVYRLVREVEPNEVLYNFLHGSVAALDKETDGTAIANFHLWFTVHLCSLLGFSPANSWHEGYWFDIIEGTFGVKPKSGIAIAPENSELLWMLMSAKNDSLADIPLSHRQRADFLSSLVAYLGYHLDTIGQVRSIKILSELF